VKPFCLATDNLADRRPINSPGRLPCNPVYLLCFYTVVWRLAQIGSLALAANDHEAEATFSSLTYLSEGDLYKAEIYSNCSFLEICGPVMKDKLCVHSYMIRANS
jgi:hypothetical protein